MSEADIWSDFSHLIVFGASYCQTNLLDEQCAPTAEHPLGIPFPGHTYNEKDKPNWVGHLVSRRSSDKPLLVLNYAIGGERVFGVCNQVNKRFLREQLVKLSEEDRRKALYAVFVGINDVCWPIDPVVDVGKLFAEAIEPLYASGARRFLIFSNPPRMRASGPIINPTPGFVRHHARIDAWNAALASSIAALKQTHKDARVYLLDTHALFTDIFDNPGKHGFEAAHVGRAHGGAVWMDGLHPTSRVHGIIADEVQALLQGGKQAQTNRALYEHPF